MFYSTRWDISTVIRRIGTVRCRDTCAPQLQRRTGQDKLSKTTQNSNPFCDSAKIKAPSSETVLKLAEGRHIWLEALALANSIDDRGSSIARAQRILQSKAKHLSEYMLISLIP